MDLFAKAEIRHTKGTSPVATTANQLLSEQDFEQAWAEITAWDGYAATPLVDLGALADSLTIAKVLYKHEGPRFGLGSFKALGAAYAALRVLQRQVSRRTGQQVSLSSIRSGEHAEICSEITLVSATDGNHGRSLAWGCQRFGVPCRIYIHAEVSEGRAQAMRDLGAKVIRIDGDYDDSVALARDEAEQQGWFVVSDTSWPGYTDPPRDVMAGYGVMTREICEALDQAPTHIFLQGGVGGLAASVAAALRQYWQQGAPRVVVVEPDLAACLYESARAGRATTVTISEETIMAGLSCGEPSEMAWEILEQEASDFITIPDSIVAPTVRLLARPQGTDPVVEAGESAVAGLAALIAARQDPELSDRLGLNAQSRVLLIGSEGVTDREIFAQIMAENDDV
ncbi:diaminopropionate ammonia-lyase [Parasedimentitalea psychrophila]|uniref:Diaminopropionate ammonia-lyase n=1 Tax=Parasedimentitalea psychrophila TaxID=2997337 RepID=A0A9Y2L1V0_9RHOB|nr:diaminopropionate ammonia-lyase [Parasedimentitalea psychrophila]WIY26773.1 diaminopropionate ammonia-lyase [Parasedimentitalea psychrophila]